MKHLEAALKELKKDRARDPNGWINDLFQDGVAGNDLKISMLAMFNKIRSEKYYPSFIRKADITSL